MSKTLCTFSGKNGDILWSLPTAKKIAALVAGGKVDFAVMPYYENLLPLLEAQEYIDKAFVIKDWLRTHSNHGDQPWQPPQKEVDGEFEILRFINNEDGTEGQIAHHEVMHYQQVYHLTYKAHPGISAPSMPLIDFIAFQQGIQLTDRDPFITVPDDQEKEFSIIHLSSGRFTDVVKENRLITYSFNEQYDQMKKEFFESLWLRLNTEFEFFNAASAKWLPAAWAIKHSVAFVGCRSANWVLAVGLGQDTITYEPHPARHYQGHLGKIFGYPGMKELTTPFGLPPVAAAEMVAGVIRQRREVNVKAAGQ
jgi:hypothetical protein